MEGLTGGVPARQPPFAVRALVGAEGGVLQGADDARGLAEGGAPQQAQVAGGDLVVEDGGGGRPEEEAVDTRERRRKRAPLHAADVILARIDHAWQTLVHTQFGAARGTCSTDNFIN